MATGTHVTTRAPRARGWSTVRYSSSGALGDTSRRATEVSGSTTPATNAVASTTWRRREALCTTALARPSTANSPVATDVTKGRPVPNRFRDFGPTRPSPFILRSTLLLLSISPSVSASPTSPPQAGGGFLRSPVRGRRVPAATGYDCRASSYGPGKRRSWVTGTVTAYPGRTSQGRCDAPADELRRRAAHLLTHGGAEHVPGRGP